MGRIFVCDQCGKHLYIPFANGNHHVHTAEKTYHAVGPLTITGVDKDVINSKLGESDMIPDQ